MTTPVNLGLRTRLSAIVFVVIGLVTLPLIYGGLILLQRQARADAERQLVSTNRLVRDLVSSHYDTVSNDLARLADALRSRFPGPISRAPDGDDLLHDGIPLSRSAGAERLGGQEAAADAALFRVHLRAGEHAFRPIAGSDDASAAPPLELDAAVVATLAGGGAWTGRVRLGGVTHLARLLPITAQHGELIGLFLVGIDLVREFGQLREYLGAFSIGPSGYIFIIDAEPGPDYGKFVVHPAKQGVSLLSEGDERGRSITRTMLERREGVLEYDWRNEARGEASLRHKLAVFAPLDRLGWLVGVGAYEDEYAYGSARLSAALVIGLLLTSVVLIVVLNVAIGRWVIDPMLRLQRTLRTLSRGNETLVHSSSEHALTDGICRVLVETGAFAFARIGLLDDAGRPCAAASAGRAAIFEAGLVVGGQITGDPADDAVRERRVLHFGPPPEASALGAACAAAGCRALIVFPLLVADRAIGALTIGASQPADLDRAGIALLRELAEDLAFGVASQRTAAARTAAEAALRLRERAIEASSDAVFIVDAATPALLVNYANPAMARLSGRDATALAGTALATLQTFNRDSLAALVSAVALRRAHELELEGTWPDGSSFWCECSLAPVAGDGGRAAHVVIGVIKDVTERMRYLRQIEHQAKYDALTGLPNRSLLDDRLAQALIAARRHGRSVAVAFIDLDHFKLVNDNLGHRHGDRLLQEVAARLAGALRSGDTAARQGGDEFVVVLPDLADGRDSYDVLAKVRAELARPIELDGREFVVTCSIGVSVAPKDADDADALLRNADIAMYQAKAGGRDAIRFFTSSMNERVRERVALEQALRGALARNEFHVAFQPQVHAASGRVCGAEALLRWNSPELGAVSPAQFIPLAEELGLIDAIGEWVLREACRQALAWHAAGAELRIAVNVSARQLDDPELPQRVAAVLAETGLPPHLLELELTESMLMENTERAASMLLRLKAIGLMLSLDDFGTGYSSFAYLQHFPIDTLKIDQSFVRNLDTGSNGASIVAAIIAMAHRLGMQVVAEGVETAGQRDGLRAHGCDVLQGYLFGRPAPARDFPRAGAAAGGREALSGTGSRSAAS